MNFLNSSEVLRTGCVAASFFVGVLLAALSNCLADALGWEPRFRSPWRRRNLPNDSPLRPLTLEFVPILGWFFTAPAAFRVCPLRKRSEKGKASDAILHGCESPFFWLRPLFVEILFATLIAYRWLVWRDVSSDGWILNWGIETFFWTAILIASLVDLDDCIIPDVVTIPSAVVGLVWSAALPAFVLFFPTYWSINLTEPSDVTSFVSALTTTLGADSGEGLSVETLWIALGVLILLWTAWNFALLDRRFYLRLGFRRAFAIFFRRIRRSGLTPILVWIWGSGVVALLAFGLCVQNESSCLGVSNLDSLATSFFGLLVGVVMVWLVRLFAGFVLGMEAMGFGDVILGGVIGCFIGWQGIVVVFFVAPFLALIYGGIRRCFNSSKEIPYGPFLSLGCVVYVVYREFFLDAFAPFFNDLVFAAFIGCCGAVLLVVMLFLLRAVKLLFAGRSQSADEEV